jgi:hypothetical protein
VTFQDVMIDGKPLVPAAVKKNPFVRGVVVRP